MKINKILKKYKELHKKHNASWKDSLKRIRDASKEDCFPNEEVYQRESYNFQMKGNRLLDSMMKELEGHEIFPKKNKKTLNNKK